MSQVQIEKGIPVPPRFGPLAAVQRGLMEVGDSYFIKGENAASERNRVHSWRQHNRPEWSFSVRRVEGGVRVWRVA